MITLLFIFILWIVCSIVVHKHVERVANLGISPTPKEHMLFVIFAPAVLLGAAISWAAEHPTEHEE